MLSGSTGTPKASRCLLVWLQAFTALLAVLLAWEPTSWLPKACDALDWLGSSVGVCECRSALGPCWEDQLIYRAEAAVMLLYVGLMLLVVSGCGAGAAHAYPVLKFFVVFGATAAFLFLPNQLFSAFGFFSGIASGVFLVIQTVPLIDFAYTWNESWFSFGMGARRVHFSSRGFNGWMAMIIVASIFLLTCALSGIIHLYIVWPEVWWLVTSAMVISLALLVVSITEWCEHGALLTSSAVMAYSVWLCYEVVGAAPSSSDDHALAAVLKWVGIIISSCTLAAFAFMPSLGSTAATEAALPIAEGDSATQDVSSADFVVQCAVHAAASVYVASVLAPCLNSATFVARTVALFMSLILYGWTLVAPKVLTSRAF